MTSHINNYIFIVYSNKFWRHYFYINKFVFIIRISINSKLFQIFQSSLYIVSYFIKSGDKITIEYRYSNHLANKDFRL